MLLTVVNGTLVDVVWNATNKDTAKKSKLVEAIAGTYGMAKAAKLGEWNVQAAAVQAELLKVQDPAKIALKADGTSDAVLGRLAPPDGDPPRHRGPRGRSLIARPGPARGPRARRGCRHRRRQPPFFARTPPD